MTIIPDIGKTFVGKIEIAINKENFKDRNTFFKRSVTWLMNELLRNKDFKTLNLKKETYTITFQLNIKPKRLIYVSAKEQAEKLQKEAKNLIKVVKK